MGPERLEGGRIAVARPGQCARRAGQAPRGPPAPGAGPRFVGRAGRAPPGPCPDRPRVDVPVGRRDGQGPSRGTRGTRHSRCLPERGDAAGAPRARGAPTAHRGRACGPGRRSAERGRAPRASTPGVSALDTRDRRDSCTSPSTPSRRTSRRSTRSSAHRRVPRRWRGLANAGSSSEQFTRGGSHWG